jgi:peptidoglycan hydrolase CwlO-like protein
MNSTSIIDGAKAEIKRLQGEIARVQKARDALGLPDLVKRVNDLVGQLQNFYDKINTVKAQIPPEEARIVGYLKEIDILPNKTMKLETESATIILNLLKLTT